MKSIKPGFIKQKGEDLFKDINPESKMANIWKTYPASVFESVLARVTVLINTHTHTTLNALQLYAHSCKMTTAKGSTGQTHILDKSSLYRRSTETSAARKYTTLPHSLKNHRQIPSYRTSKNIRISRITKIRLRFCFVYRVDLNNLGWKDNFSEGQGWLLSSNLDCTLPTMAPTNT